ncbi:MAG: hypothetical protein HC929_24335 [Leptolyngbyaceae cyanobacterium SM2_5_2]|nr:hypothetical protein [Leptolyngbyaceae cyanobacterium SM2_5_2]
MSFSRASLKSLLALLSATIWVSPLAIRPAFAQRNTPYCFVVRERLNVFSRPDNNAATADAFNLNDIAYATANPPRTVVSGGSVLC